MGAHSRLMAWVNQISGAGERKVEDNPSPERVARAVVHTWIETADQTAVMLALHEQLVWISRGVWAGAILLAGLLVRAFLVPS